MFKILQACGNWLLRKAATFIVILLILVAGAYVEQARQDIERQNRELDEQKQILDRARSDLVGRSEKVLNLGKSAGKQLEKISSLEKAYQTAIAFEAEARKTFERSSSQVGPWQYVFDRGKVLEKKLAWIGYEAAKRATASAKVLRDALGPAENTVETKDLRKAIESEAQKIQDIQTLEAQISQKEGSINQHWLQKLKMVALANVETALWIIAGVIVVPVILKAILYWGVAPLAARFPPIRLLPESAGAVSCSPARAVVEVILPPGRELLVRASCLNGVGESALKCTKWFFNSRLPMSSIAAGLFKLTRISCRDDKTEKVSVIASSSPLSEIAMLELTTGAAMVVHPRCIIGAIKDAGRPVEITRHWRLFSLHSWVTLQLRFLVIHGPCTLLVQGCRGVLAEVPTQHQPRLLNQAATIGFSASLEYSNARCETFVSYFTGEEELFNDRFSGGPGCYLYEARPDERRKTGLTGRGMEGLLDAALKVFGV